MDHQLRAADIVHELIGYFGKRGLIEQKFIGNTMYAKGFRIHQPIGFEINMEVIARQATVHHFNGTNLNDLVAFIVRTNLVHTGGFGIENDLACNCSAHSGHLCQTCRFTVRFNYRKSTRDA